MELDYSDILSRMYKAFPEYGAHTGIVSDNPVQLALHSKEDKDDNILITVKSITSEEVINIFVKGV